jgi:putative nucleotidyltransferase with HDIG domain
MPEGEPYAGRWVARLRGIIVGQGGSPRQALQAAKASRLKETPQVEYMASTSTFTLPPLVERVRSVLPADQELYLVGGAVRDLLLGRPVRDLDFAVPGRAIPLGRKLANALGADFYTLDSERDAGRVLLDVDGKQAILDFVALQGDIDADLAARDLTINAMALDLRQPDALLDPLSGAADLRAKRLRACGPRSFESDPVRVLRAVRMAAAFGMQIESETRKWLRAAAAGLTLVSAERLRDEWLRLLLAPKPAASLRALDLLGALEGSFPELVRLKGVTQSAPHIYDVWEHTLHVVEKLEFAFAALDENYPAEGASDFASGLIVLRLGRFRSQLSQHLAAEMVAERPRRALLLLAALLHDSGKPLTRRVEPSGRIRFFGHEAAGANLAAERGAALHLSGEEIAYLDTVVANHMRPAALTRTGQLPSRRAIYRYFRDTGAAGVDICLLSLADMLGKNVTEINEAEFKAHLETLRTLLEAYYEKPEESVSPPILINGDELMSELGLKPSRKIGEILEALREAQAMGNVTDRAGAIAFARNFRSRLN